MNAEQEAARLQLILGPAPINVATPEQRQAARQWLIAKGVPAPRAMHAKDYALSAAYNDYFQRRGRYLAKMIEGTTTGQERGAAPARDRDRYSGLRANLFASSDDFDIDGAAAEVQFERAAEALSASEAESEIVTLTKGAIASATTAAVNAQLDNLRGELHEHIAQVVAGTRLSLSEDAKASIRALAAEATRETIAALAPPRKIEIVNADGATVAALGLQHEKFPLLLRALGARDHRGFRLNIWLTGPTGSGKTTAAEAASAALASTFTRYARSADGRWTITNEDGTPADLNGLSHDGPFGADSSLDADYKIVGFKDANGRFHWTTFLRVFAFGGVYVADEIDNWMPSALVALNAALANGWISTPIGIIRRHPDAAIIAAANTWGMGATAEYVGRAKLDAATINRFPTKIAWPIDERLEAAIAAEMDGSHWCDVVQAARCAAAAQGLHVIFSPRNTFDGIALLRSGFSVREVVEMNLTPGLRPEQIAALGIDALLPASAPSSVSASTSAERARGRLREYQQVSYTQMAPS